MRASSASAAAWRALSLVSVFSVARTRAATRARRAASCTCWRKSGSRRCLRHSLPQRIGHARRLDGCQRAHGGLALTAMAARVCVVGSVNADLTFTVDALPRPGQTVLASSLSSAPGGKGGNQAVAAARQAPRCSLLRRSAPTPAAERLRAHLRDNEVGLDGVVSLPGPSGSAAIIVDATAENAIVVAPGAERTPERGLRRRPGRDLRQRRRADAVGDPDRRRHRGRPGRAGRGRGRHRQRVTGRREAP